MIVYLARKYLISSKGPERGVSTNERINIKEIIHTKMNIPKDIKR